MAHPISPSEVEVKRRETFPEEVFEVFNALIVEAWNGYEAIVFQDDATKGINAVLGTINREVDKRFLLDVEDFYRAVGWIVEYEKPDFNQVGRAFFRFRKKG